MPEFKLFNLTINVEDILVTIIYIFLGILIYQILNKIIEKAFKLERIKKKEHKQKAETMKTIISSIIKYITVIVVVLAVLSLWGINVSTILAGLGITTAIIGLAFQDLAKDIIAGIAIITEDQFEIGDVIEVNGFMGEVISMGLKTTRIRNAKGAVQIIANHNLDKIINYSLSDSLAIVDVAVAYEHDSAEVEKVLKDLALSLKDKVPNAKGDINVLGIENLGDSGITYRLTVKVIPTKYFETERYLRREVKEALDKANIKIPYPQIEVHNGK